MSELLMINDIVSELTALQLDSSPLNRYNSAVIIDNAFKRLSRQLAGYQLDLIRRFFEVHPAGMVQPGTFIITPGHQLQTMADEYVGDDELGGESTCIPDRGMKDGDHSETHETINIAPWMASILNPDPHQPQQSAEAIKSLFMLLGADAHSQVIQISRSTVASAVETLRQYRSPLEVNINVELERQKVEASLREVPCNGRPGQTARTKPLNLGARI